MDMGLDAHQLFFLRELDNMHTAMLRDAIEECSGTEIQEPITL